MRLSRGKYMSFLINFPSHTVKPVNWRTFVLTKVVISDYKVLIASVSGKLWHQILNDHWFWNSGFKILLKSWTNLANRKSFSDTVLPKKDNKSTKSSLHNRVYGQSNSMHLFYLFPHLYFDGFASFLRRGWEHLPVMKQEITEKKNWLMMEINVLSR